MKIKNIKNPFHTISFKYDSAKWTDADEQFIKNFTDITTEAYEVRKTYQPLRNRIKKLLQTVGELNTELPKIKMRRDKLIEDKMLFDKMKKPEQQKIKIAFIQKMDIFNIDVVVYEKKMQQHLAACGEMHKSIQACHLAYNNVAEKYDKIDDLQSEYFLRTERAIDYELFIPSIMELEQKWDDFEEKYDVVMEEWENFVVPHNEYMAFHDEYFTAVNEKNLQEKEQEKKEEKKYDIPEGMGEQYIELYEKFENAEKSESNIYLDIDEWGLLIDFYHVVDDDERRIYTTDRAMKQHPDAAQFKLRKSAAYVMAHEYQKAIALHKEVEAMGLPYPAALHNSKGLMYDNMKMPDKAAIEYQNCIDACDDSVGGLRSQAYINLALLLKGQKKYAEAIESLKLCIKNKHHNEKVINEIAYTYELTGQVSEAIELLEYFLGKNPSFHIVWLTLGNMYAQAKLPDKALEAYKKMLELQPGLPEALMSVGESLRRAGNFKEAIGYYQQAITNDKNDYIYHFCIGQCMEGLEDYANAKLYYKNAFSLNPDFAFSLDCLKRLKEEGK